MKVKGLAKIALALCASLNCTCPGPVHERDTVDMADRYAQGYVTELKNFSEYQDFISNTELPVVVDFYGSFCGPCKLAEKPFEDSAQEYKGRMRFGRTDSAKNKMASKSAGIEAVPTFLFFKNSKERYRVVGFTSEEELKFTIDKIYQELADE